MEGDAGGGDGNSVFVGDGDDGRWRGLGRGGGEKCEREEECTHAVRIILRWDAFGSVLDCPKTPILAQKRTREMRHRWGMRRHLLEGF